MSEFSTANYNINRFDKTASVPTAQVDKQAEMQTANKWKQIADGIGMFADKGGEAYAAKLNRDRRDEAEARRKKAEAQQEENIQKNLALIKAEKIYTETGGAKSWHELNEEEKDFQVESNKMGMQAPGVGKITLSEADKKNKFLKEAYQTKRTAAILKKHQANWNEVAPNLVDKVYEEWYAQRNTEGGEPNWSKYSTAKLEIYKLERAEEHLVGLPMLGEARKLVPENDTKYLSATSIKQTEYDEELIDKSIQAGLDNALLVREGNDEPEEDLSSAKEIDDVIESIAYQKNEKGEKIVIYDKIRVQEQLLDDLTFKLDKVTDPDDPLFKVVKSLQSKRGKSFFDRRGGNPPIGKQWKTWWKAAIKKRSDLRKTKISNNNAANKQEIVKAKQTSTSHLILAKSALTVKDPTPEEIKKAQESGSEIPLSRLDALRSSLIRLRANAHPFTVAAGDYGDKFSQTEASLVEAIRKLDPTDPTFNVPDNPKAVEQTNNFKKEISTMSPEEIRELRIELAKKPSLPWVATMQENALDERETEITEELNQKKKALELANAGNLAKNKRFEEKSKKLAIKERENLMGYTKSADVKTNLEAILKRKDLRPEEIASLDEKFKTKLKKLEDKEGADRDSKAFTGYFKEVTTYKEGEFPSQSEINDLEGKINNHKWYGTERQRQLTGLLAAMKKGKGAYEKKIKDIRRDNKFLSKYNKKTGVEQEKIDTIVAEVATKKKSYKDAIKELKENKDTFLEDNSDLISEGEGYNVKLDHDELFEKGISSILAERSEVEIAEEKRNWELAAQKNSKMREEKKSTLLAKFNAVLEDPKLLEEKEYENIMDDIWNAKEIEVYSNGKSQPSVSLFDSEKILKLERSLRIAKKDKSDPTKVISDPFILKNVLTAQEKIRSATGDTKVKLIDKAIDELDEAFDNNKISWSHYKTEKQALEKSYQTGEPDTRDPYKQGDDALRLYFSSIESIYTSNKKYLNKEGLKAGVLYSNLNQEFSRIWEDIEWPEDATNQEKASKARSIANSLLKVYDYKSGEKHPGGEVLNNHIKMFKMKKADLRTYLRSDEYKAFKAGKKAVDKPDIDSTRDEKEKTNFQKSLEKPDTILQQLNSNIYISPSDDPEEELGIGGVIAHWAKSKWEGEQFVYDPFRVEDPSS